MFEGLMRALKILKEERLSNFEEEGIIGGYIPLTDVGYEYGGESGEDIVRVTVL